MPLHRDIYWVGRQWAVTGSGIQACDQKQKGQFDIEGARIWEDGVLESMRALKWLDIEDFSKALSVARARHPEPPRKAAPLQESVSNLKDSDRNNSAPMAQPRPLAQKFDMRIEGWPAKFVRQWRIRVRVGGG